MSDRAPTATEALAERRRRFAQQNRIIGIVLVFGFLLAGAAFLWLVRACACSGPTPTLPASPVEGVVVAVDAASLGDVKGFSLRTTNGVVYALSLGNLENATEFSPSHLAEHQATSSPIRAWYRIEGGVPTVYRLEDASG